MYQCISTETIKFDLQFYCRVVNLSNATFSDIQLYLLNKGICHNFNNKRNLNLLVTNTALPLHSAIRFMKTNFVRHMYIFN